MRYLEARHTRNATIHPYSDHIVVQGGVSEERFDPIPVAQGVRWKRTR